MNSNLWEALAISGLSRAIESKLTSLMQVSDDEDLKDAYRTLEKFATQVESIIGRLRKEWSETED